MRAGQSGRGLLVERIAFIPSYMQISKEQANGLIDSFANIFKSVGQSIKLLTHTLVLNINVLQGAMSNDQKKIDAAFANFKEKRAEYDEKMAENLKYFHEFYEQDGVQGLGGIGPKILAFATNPLLPFVAPKSPRKKGEKTNDTTSSSTTATSKQKAGSYTPRVSAALEFFFPKALRESRLLEQSQQPKDEQPLPPEAVEELRKAQSIARNFIEDEKKHATMVLDELGKRPAVMKKIAEAKNFEELDAAIKMASAAGLKLFDKNIMSSKKKIEDELRKKQEKDPQGFAKDVQALKQQFPDIQGKDDVEIALNATFGMSKSGIQSQLMQIYNSMVGSAMNAMGLPLNPNVKKQLEGSPIGQEYLRFVDDFTRQLETGVREAEAATKR